MIRAAININTEEMYETILKNKSKYCFSILWADFQVRWLKTINADNNNDDHINHLDDIILDTIYKEIP